ncbi:MAG: lipopolysaccharide biosynthesis protein [Alphaproteobacteria bacterium]
MTSDPGKPDPSKREAGTPNAGRSLIWALAESGGLSLLSLLVLVVVARLVGPEELGLVAIALGIVQVFTVILETSLHDAIVQRQDLTDDHLQTAFWSCAALSLLFVAGCWIGAPWLAEAFDQPALADLLRVMAFGLAMTGIGAVPIAVLRRNFLFKQLAVRSLYARLIGAVAGIGLAAAGYGIWALVAQYLLQTTFNGILIWRACPFRPARRFSFARLREMVAFGALSVGSRIVWISSVRLFTLLVGYFLGVAAVGYLNIAQRVVDTLYDLLAGAAYNLALPFFSRCQADRARLHSAYYATNEYAAMAVPPVFAGLAICAAPVVMLVLGEQWLPAVPLIQILAAAAALQFILLFSNAAITASGRPGVLFGLSLITFAFAIGGLLLLQPGDALGAALIWACRVAVSGPIILFVAWRLLGVSLATWARGVIVPFAATCAMAAGLGWLWHAHLRQVSAIEALAVMVPLGATAYGAMLLIANRAALLRLIGFMMAGLRGAKPS